MGKSAVGRSEASSHATSSVRSSSGSPRLQRPGSKFERSSAKEWVDDGGAACDILYDAIYLGMSVFASFPPGFIQREEG